MIKIKKKLSMICHRCDKIIEHEKGLIIQGNIYKIKNNIEERAGILGGTNNFDVKFKDIEEFAFCDRCIRILFRWEED